MGNRWGNSGNQVWFEIKVHDIFKFVFLSQGCLAFKVFCGSIQILGFFCSISMTNIIGIFGKDCTESANCFREYDHFCNVNFSIREHKVFSHSFVSSSISFNNVLQCIRFSHTWLNLLIGILFFLEVLMGIAFLIRLTS